MDAGIERAEDARDENQHGNERDRAPQRLAPRPDAENSRELTDDLLGHRLGLCPQVLSGSEEIGQCRQ